jgi:hypothetical protein
VYLGLPLTDHVVDEASLGPADIHEVLLASECVYSIEDGLGVILQLGSTGLKVSSELLFAAVAVERSALNGCWNNEVIHVYIPLIMGIATHLELRLVGCLAAWRGCLWRSSSTWAPFSMTTSASSALPRLEI